MKQIFLIKGPVASGKSWLAARIRTAFNNPEVFDLDGSHDTPWIKKCLDSCDAVIFCVTDYHDQTATKYLRKHGIVPDVVIETKISQRFFNRLSKAWGKGAA